MYHKGAPSYRFNHRDVSFQMLVLILDFFTSTHLEIIFQISSLEHVSHYSVIDPDFQKMSMISDFFIETDLHPCNHTTPTNLYLILSRVSI